MLSLKYFMRTNVQLWRYLIQDSVTKIKTPSQIWEGVNQYIYKSPF